MLKLIAIGGALCLAPVAANADDFSKFYTPFNQNAAILLPPDAPAETIVSSGNLGADVEQMFTKGYGLIGYSIFNGGLKDPKKTLKQAAKIKARYVIYFRGDVSTTTRVIPLTLPTSTTSSTSGTVNVYGSGGSATGNYNGTTTTYGSSTTYIPITRSRADQVATYYGPLKRSGLGMLAAELSQPERTQFGTNRGLRVRAVREESPVYNADVLPGDYILAINNQPVEMNSLAAAMANLATNPAILSISRNGQRITKVVTAVPGWE